MDDPIFKIALIVVLCVIADILRDILRELKETRKAIDNGGGSEAQETFDEFSGEGPDEEVAYCRFTRKEIRAARSAKAEAEKALGDALPATEALS
jgi:hypothetical protein